MWLGCHQRPYACQAMVSCPNAVPRRGSAAWKPATVSSGSGNCLQEPADGILRLTDRDRSNNINEC